MGMLKSPNQYLKSRGGSWYYHRRVPSKYANFDKRCTIVKALNTQALEVAQSRRNELMEADEQFWSSVASTTSGLNCHDPRSKETKLAMRMYKAAIERAMAKGFVYKTIHELVADGDLHDLTNRVEAIPEHKNVQDETEAEALLGAVSPPSVTISQALEIYFSEIAITDQKGKSEAQRKSWRKVNLRAVNNFIKVVGDLPMDEINRTHGRKIYNWWVDKVRPKDKIKIKKPCSGDTADRDIGNLRKLYRVYWEYEGDENRSNPFRNLRLGDGKNVNYTLPFETEFVRSKILVTGILDGLNQQAILLAYALIETGCRPSELANMLPENIVLDDDVPHIKIRQTKDMEIKTGSSVRDIPLVGVSLEAMKRAPNGFPHYRDKGNLLSATLMKGFKSRELLPSNNHRIYSFRHSFEQRMKEENLDYELRCLLMGHKNSRPQYGDGGSMVYRRNELLKIAHPFDDALVNSLPDLR